MANLITNLKSMRKIIKFFTKIKRLIFIIISIVIFAFLFQDYYQKKIEGKKIFYYSRARYLISQINHINKGHYLSRIINEKKVSSIRNYHDDYGNLVWLANVALVKRIFQGSQFKMDVKDAYKIELYTIIIFILIIFLPIIPFRASLSGVLCLFILYFSNILKWDINFRWPPILSTLITLIMLYIFVEKLSQEINWKDILQLLFLSVFAGWLYHLRKDGYFIFLLPFVVIFLFNLILFLFNCAKIIIRKGYKYLTTNFKLIEKISITTIVLSLSAIIGFTVITKVIIYSDIKLFEIIEKTEHYPEGKGHSTWHPIYMGIGGARIDQGKVYNQENIIWIDRCAYSHVFQKHLSVGRLGKYDSRLKKMYFHIAKKNFNDLVRVYSLKILDLFEKVRLIKSIILLLLIIAIIVLLFFLKNKSPYGVIFITGLLTTLGVASLPSILTRIHSEFLLGFETALISGIFFSICTIYFIVNEPAKNCPSLEKYTVCLKYPLIVISITLFISFGIMFIHFSNISNHRNHLTYLLENNKILYKNFLKEYHADIIYGFNALNENKKREFINKAVKEYGYSLKGTLVRIKKPRLYEILHIGLEKDRIFLFLSFKGKTSDLSHPYMYIPVTYEMRLKGKIIIPYYANIVRIPNPQQKGIWVYSFLANKTTRKINFYGIKRKRVVGSNGYMSKTYKKEEVLYKLILKKDFENIANELLDIEYIKMPPKLDIIDETFIFETASKPGKYEFQWNLK